MPTWCIMSGNSRGVAESAVRRLGPLPRRMRLYNMALPQGAIRRVLAGTTREIAEADNVVRPGVQASVVEQRDWYRITNQAGAVTVDIFDEIGFWGVNAAAFQRELAQVNASEITVNLSSPGGEIFEGIAIYNALRTHPANVTIRVSALAASIASVIAQAGDRIVMLSGAQMMIHEGMGICAGNAAEMQEMAKLLDRQSANIADIYAERAGGTSDEWRARMQAETWFNADEAVAAGLADEVEVLARKGEQAAETVTARWDLSIFNYAGREHAPAPVITSDATPTVWSTAQPDRPPITVHLEGTAEQVAEQARQFLSAVPTAEEPKPEADAPLTNEAPPIEEPAPEPDPWAALTARLCQPAPDPWAAAVAHLTDTTTSHSAATGMPKEAS